MDIGEIRAWKETQMIRLAILFVLFALPAQAHVEFSLRETPNPLSSVQLKGERVTCDSFNAMRAYPSVVVALRERSMAVAKVNEDAGYESCRVTDIAGWHIREILQQSTDGTDDLLLVRAGMPYVSEAERFLFLWVKK